MSGRPGYVDLADLADWMRRQDRARKAYREEPGAFGDMLNEPCGWCRSRKHRRCSGWRLDPETHDYTLRCQCSLARHAPETSTDPHILKASLSHRQENQP